MRSVELKHKVILTGPLTKALDCVNMITLLGN